MKLYEQCSALLIILTRSSRMLRKQECISNIIISILQKKILSSYDFVSLFQMENTGYFQEVRWCHGLRLRHCSHLGCSLLLFPLQLGEESLEKMV